MGQSTTSGQSYEISFDERLQTSVGLVEGVERTPELDALAVALVEAYQTFTRACGMRPYSSLTYSEFANTTTTALLVERGNGD